MGRTCSTWRRRALSPPIQTSTQKEKPTTTRNKNSEFSRQWRVPCAGTYNPQQEQQGPFFFLSPRRCAHPFPPYRAPPSPIGSTYLFCSLSHANERSISTCTFVDVYESLRVIIASYSRNE